MKYLYFRSYSLINIFLNRGLYEILYSVLLMVSRMVGAPVA